MKSWIDLRQHIQNGFGTILTLLGLAVWTIVPFWLFSSFPEHLRIGIAWIVAIYLWWFVWRRAYSRNKARTGSPLPSLKADAEHAFLMLVLGFFSIAVILFCCFAIGWLFNLFGVERVNEWVNKLFGFVFRTD